jgi:hypothetical protein
MFKHACVMSESMSHMCRLDSEQRCPPYVTIRRSQKIIPSAQSTMLKSELARSENTHH